MVDFRPLLFINALALMLLITAGIAMGDRKLFSENEIFPGVDRAGEIADDRPAVAASAKPLQASDSANTGASSNDAPAENSAAVEPVFTGSTEDNQGGDAGATADQPADSEQLAAEPLPAGDQLAMAAPRLPESKSESTPVTEPAPAAETQAKPVEKPAPTTGQLVLRSNVVDDLVKINGEPKGSTRLDVRLQPGTYDVEISKPGYQPWRDQVDVAAGDALTLRAELAKLTRVEFRDGEWLGGVKTGDGSYQDADGLRYEGHFVDGKFHGQGTAWYPDGSRYEGEWENGERYGDGRLRAADGSSYSGQFEDNEFSGQGTLTLANGDVLTGQWRDGRLNGHGSLTKADGMLYVGGFRNNEYHGQGTLTWPNGRVYEGQFVTGKFHGNGVEIFEDGKKYEGQFVEGEFHGRGLMLNPNGSSIEAVYRYGKPYGQVKLTTAQGEVFTARTSEPGVCYRENSYRATQCPELEGW